MIRAILLALLTALLACSAPSEAPRVAEVLRLTVRFQAGMQADHRVRAREAIATAWMGTGAVVLVEGAPWESVPTPTAGPCTSEVHVGWLDPSSPDAPSDPKKIGIGYDRCTVRAALLVRGRARDDQIERAFAHESMVSRESSMATSTTRPRPERSRTARAAITAIAVYIPAITSPPGSWRLGSKTWPRWRARRTGASFAARTGAIAHDLFSKNRPGVVDW